MEDSKVRQVRKAPDGVDNIDQTKEKELRRKYPDVEDLVASTEYSSAEEEVKTEIVTTIHQLLANEEQALKEINEQYEKKRTEAKYVRPKSPNVPMPVAVLILLIFAAAIYNGITTT